MNPRHIVTLGIEEFVPESGRVTDVLYDDQTETIMIEYEETNNKALDAQEAVT